MLPYIQYTKMDSVKEGGARREKREKGKKRRGGR